MMEPDRVTRVPVHLRTRTLLEEMLFLLRPEVLGFRPKCGHYYFVTHFRSPDSQVR